MNVASRKPRPDALPLPGTFHPRHVVLYDGVCGLCNRLVRWLLGADHDEILGFVSLQSPTAEHLLGSYGRPLALETLYVLADADSPAPRLLSKSTAVVLLLDATGWTRTARLLDAVPRVLRDRGYDLVAAHRYRVFGRHDSCPVPAAEHLRRFLDLGGSPPASTG